MSQEQIAKVLAEHRVSTVRVGSHAGIERMPDIGVYEQRCRTCGSIEEYQSDHQAAVLAPLFAEAQAEAWDAGKEAFGASLLTPLGRNSMRTESPNPYRLAQFQADPEGRALVAGIHERKQAKTNNG